MGEGDCDHAAAFGTASGSARLLLPCGEEGRSILLCACEIRIAFLPSAVDAHRLQLNQRADAEPFRACGVYVLTRNDILPIRLRSIALLHERFPGAFMDVNHGIAIAPRAITELIRVKKAMWIMSQMRSDEAGTYRRMVYAKLSRRGYRALRRRMVLPKVHLRRDE